MPIYQKKPIRVPAMQWTGKNLKKIKDFLQDVHNQITLPMGTQLQIDTVNGRSYAKLYDYILKDVKGDAYACPKEVFEETYEEVKA